MIDLTTLDEVKAAMESSDNEFDTNLSERITDVSHRIQSWLDRDLQLQTYVEIKDGGCPRIYIFNPPIVSITKIVSSVIFDFTQGTTLPTSDYLIVNQNWDIDHLFRFPGGRNMLEVTYIGGYLDASDTLSTLKKDLRGATTKQVVFEFQNRKFIGQQTIDVADGQIGIPEQQFLDSVKAVLRRYRTTKLG